MRNKIVKKNVITGIRNMSFACFFVRSFVRKKLIEIINRTNNPAGISSLICV
ncbi:MAG: hypothetical protein WCY80_01875 [Candidatus Izemoplasmatales bacterium]